MKGDFIPLVYFTSSTRSHDDLRVMTYRTRDRTMYKKGTTMRIYRDGWWWEPFGWDQDHPYSRCFPTRTAALDDARRWISEETP